jgi:hypothetical protein
MSFFDEGESRFGTIPPPPSTPHNYRRVDEDDNNEGQEAFVEMVGLIVGQVLAYNIYRRMGAPRWAAYGFAALSATMYGGSSEAHKARAEKAAAWLTDWIDSKTR